MLPINDLLPIELPASATQAVDINAELMPDSDLSATFSDILRKPLMAEHVEFADIAGDELPLTGSPLPEDIVPDHTDLSRAVNRDIDPELPLQLLPAATPTTVNSNIPIQEDALTLAEVDALPLGDDPEMPVHAVNPAPPEIRLDEQPRAIDHRRQRSAIDPFARQPLRPVKSPEGVQNLADEPAFAERLTPVREFPQITQPQTQRSQPEPIPTITDRITPEVSTNAMVNAKVEGGEQIQKPVIQFNGIATNGVPVDTSQVRQPSPATTAPAPVVATTIDVPVLDKTWGHALQDRVMWMTGRGVQNAEIRLNPAELGPIRIQVTVENDAAQLAFSAQHAVTRDAIEQAMPRLREMLAESGLSLGGSSVSDGGNKDVKRDQETADLAVRDDGSQQEQEELDISASPIREPSPSSLIDTFA